MLALKDRLNTDDGFVHYKTLVGYEAVFPPDWEEEEYDREAYRLERVEEFVENIDESNFGEWRAIIARCAATESNDLATFPVFSEFIVRLSQRKPSLVVSLLAGEDPHIANFLPAFFLGSRWLSIAATIRKPLQMQRQNPKKHLALIRHYRKVGPPHADTIKPLLESAIARDDDNAVIESLVLAIEHHKPITLDLKVAIFSPALAYLTSSKMRAGFEADRSFNRRPFLKGLASLKPSLFLQI